MFDKKEYQKKWHKKHYQEHKEEEKNYMKQYYQKHKEERKEYAKIYYLQHPDNKSGERSGERKEYMKNYMKEWKKKYPEKVKEYTKKYNQKHPHYSREYYRELKKWAVDKLGRKCNKCNLVSNYDCIYDFHHLNKEESWLRKERYTNKFKVQELLKWRKNNEIPNSVILLCANCHRIIEFEIRRNVNELDKM